MIKIENAIVIRINADDTCSVDYLDNGSVIHKVVSVKEVLNALIQSTRANCIVKSGVLPKNCVSYSCDMESGDKYYIIDHTERKADITYHETLYKDFPLPRLVFGFGVTGEGKVKRVNVAVVDEGVELNESTSTYYYPFSNVTGFGMCTGSNKLPVYKKITALKNLPNFILSLPNNDDYYNAKHNKLNLNYRELMEHLKDKTPEYYYTDVLIKSNRTLKELF